MTPGKIIILNGASSSGKTTILRAFQDMAEEVYLDAGLDRFIYMLPRRYLYRPLWDDVLGLATQAGETGHRLLSGMHRAIVSLAQAGNNVIADHVLVERGWLDDIALLMRDCEVYLVGVMCPLEILEQREKGRKDRTLGQARAQYRRVHDPGLYDLEVDTSRMDAWECARAILEMIESGDGSGGLMNRVNFGHDRFRNSHD